MSQSMVRGVGQSTCNVVLLPHGSMGERVLDVATDWVASGLLEPVFWVTADQVTDLDRPVTSILATVIGLTKEGQPERRPVPLLAALGRQHADNVIVSVMRWIGDGDSDNSTPVHVAANALLAALFDALPTARNTRAGVELRSPGTRSRILNLIFGSTRAQDSGIEMLLVSPRSADFDADVENILVSPEDRSAPGRADRFTDVRDIDHWAGFIVAATASLSGLWTGMTSSPVPRTQGSTPAGSLPGIRVARTFTRAIMTDGFAATVAQQATEILRSGVSPLTDPSVGIRVQGLVAMSDDAAWDATEGALAYARHLDRGALCYQRPGKLEDAPEGKIRWWKAQSAFLRFSWDKVSAIPTWILEWFAERLGRKATQDLYGTDTGIQVDARSDVGLKGSDRDLLDVAIAVSSLRERVSVAVSQPPLPVARVAMPALWEGLNSVVFTLADGSADDPNFAPSVDENGRVQVVPDLGLIVPSPRDVWTMPTDALGAARDLDPLISAATGITWLEVAEAQDLLGHLDQKLERQIERMAKLQDGHRQYRRLLLEAEEECTIAREAWEDQTDRLDDAQVALADHLELVMSSTEPSVSGDPAHDLLLVEGGRGA